MSERLRVAAIITIYHPKAHADVIVTKFLKGMSTDEGLPRNYIVSIYLDHVLENDIGVGLAEEYDVSIYPSIRRALHAGANELNVDAVLLVGEHGDYPWNERGRHMYPRRYFFEQIAGVFGESGRSVPVFNDKHFAYDFADAQWVWNRAQELEIPLWPARAFPCAGATPLSSMTGRQRRGSTLHWLWRHRRGGYHALETMQCMIERRVGGETGIKSRQCLEGDAVWQAGQDGLWSRELADAAVGAIVNKPDGPMEEQVKDPAVFLIEYADGLKAATLMLSGYVQEFAYAARVDGQVHGVEFFLQNEGPFAHFSYLCQNIQRYFASGKAPYPPERTLLTTGIIDAVMNSRYEGHRRVETSYLDIAYTSYDALPVARWGRVPGHLCRS